jgi:2-polyprenyl-3-methyl-5-hydroxy-6-metoxy-1,4-benzoquinol methylase
VDLVDGIAANTTKGTVREVMRLVARGKPRTVLDAPCGRGALSSLAHKAGLEVTALELDRGDFDVPGVKFIAGNLNQDLPIDNESFDSVACVDGIEHLENPFHAIREFHRVLKPGGTLVISTPNISAWRSRARYLFTGFHNKGKLPLTEEAPSPLHHINLLSYPMLRYMLVRNGFEISEVSTNRVKSAAMAFGLLYPFVAFATWFVFRQEENSRQRQINRTIYRDLLSRPIAMGETMIIRATRR